MEYHLVRFKEDGVLYVWENKRVAKGNGTSNRMVRYKTYGTFKADILYSGEKQVMFEHMKSLQVNKKDISVEPEVFDSMYGMCN
ncbi:hypothetical protein CBL_12810 [Carabus blaptoides fortunei]